MLGSSSLINPERKRMLYACHRRHLNRDINIIFYTSVAAADVPNCGDIIIINVSCVMDDGDDDDGGGGFGRSHKPIGKDMNAEEGSWLAEGLETNFIFYFIFLIFFRFSIFSLFFAYVFTA